MKSFKDLTETETKQLNDDLTLILADSIKKLESISEKYNIEMDDIKKQYIGTFDNHRRLIDAEYLKTVNS